MKLSLAQQVSKCTAKPREKSLTGDVLPVGEYSDLVVTVKLSQQRGHADEDAGAAV